MGFFSELYHPEVNGTVTSITRFEEELDRAGHPVSVFAPADQLLGRFGGQDGRVHRFHSIDYPLYRGFRISFPLYGPVRGKLDRLRLDVVHSHTPFSLGIFAERIARKHGVPHVHTYHTRWPLYARHYMPGHAGMNERMVRRCLATFCNVTDRVIAPSDAIRDRLRDEGVRTPIDVIPTPIEAAAFAAGSVGRPVRERHGIPAGAPLVLTLSRLGSEKSIDFLLRAFARLAASRPDAWFLVVGDGPARERLEELARQLAVRQVVFAGELRERKDVLRAYAAANVFAYASRTETQCLTMLEAAAAGLPLVARYDDALVGALEPGVNGDFVHGDEAAFATALERLLAAPSLAAEYGRASREIANRHGPARRMQELLETYERARAGGT